VAAHYALPQSSAPTATVAPASTSAPAPPVAQPPVKESSNEVVQAPITEEQKSAAAEDHPVIAGTKDTENGTATSGTLAVASTEQPKLSLKIAYTGLGFGAVLVLAGTIVEIRRFLRHLPLVPKIHN